MNPFDPLRIRTFREAKGLTQLDTIILLRAHGVDITPETLSRWERDTSDVDANVLPALASVFGIKVEAFFQGPSDGR